MKQILLYFGILVFFGYWIFTDDSDIEKIQASLFVIVTYLFLIVFKIYTNDRK